MLKKNDLLDIAKSEDINLGRQSGIIDMIEETKSREEETPADRERETANYLLDNEISTPSRSKKGKNAVEAQTLKFILKTLEQKFTEI